MTSSKRHGCPCEKCRECCEREPGWFLPEEIQAAAAYLNLGENEFVQKFCTEHIEANVMALSPATKKGSSKCVFLNRLGLCEIHPAKPYECRKVYGCEGPSRHRKIRERIKKEWKK